MDLDIDASGGPDSGEANRATLRHSDCFHVFRCENLREVKLDSAVRLNVDLHRSSGNTRTSYANNKLVIVNRGKVNRGCSRLAFEYLLRHIKIESAPPAPPQGMVVFGVRSFGTAPK